jgi:hypothetical protein
LQRVASRSRAARTSCIVAQLDSRGTAPRARRGLARPLAATVSMAAQSKARRMTASIANVFGSLLCVDADDTHMLCGDDGFTYKVADARAVARKEERIG